ncbi:YhaN family protein [Salinisphaera sp. Q1T1-3]|uniref:ATP-binding protein n=1 Tax=Salinisphaera sp. Q1T1-3 TaxID=2321229 RepID=UPI000E76F0C5|nr:YhaN family protein [Salinisphaera sp. Q1T1-3]RJS93055.1 hypothetical protein D3260_09145 [Salinisphaera sp. Q1T1-3]
MRFAALQLRAYGHFTGRDLVFESGAHDLQLVYGANEAGKTTARAAIGDFLFGFPAQTSLNFRHAYNALRIGARIEAGSDAPFTAVRKKGRKNTLLDDDGEAANALETRLARALAGADRAFFSRMFSLDHDGLRAGGQALASAGAGADTALLSAGSGLADILAERSRLAGEADMLWAPNASASRRYYQAETRLKQADQTIQTHEITASQWRRLRDALAEAESRYDTRVETRHRAHRQWLELERIRRVAPAVRRHRQIEAELDELDIPPDLGGDARRVHDEAQETIETATAAIETIEAHIARLDEELASLTDDPALREAAPAIERLGEQRSRIDDDRERLAELEGERDRLAEALAADRRELDWHTADPAWPGSTEIAGARRLAGEADGHARDLTHARENLAAARETEARLAAEARANGARQPTDALSAWLDAATREGDLEAELRAGQQSLDQIGRRIERRLAALDPAVTDSETLSALDVPRRDAVDAFAEAITDAENTRRGLQTRVEELTDETARVRDALQRRRADDALPSETDLTQARRRRDACWQLVRQRYVAQRERDLFDEPGDEEALDDEARAHPAEALAAAIRQADTFADARFEHHEALARDAEQQRQVADREQALKQATGRLEAADARLEGLRTEWNALWQPAEITPGGPKAMREWLDHRRAVLDAHDEYIDAQSAHESIAHRVTTHRSQLAPQLSALGVPDDEIAEAALAQLIERARGLVALEARRAEAQQRIDREQQDVDARLARLASEQEHAQAAHRDWQDAWSRALAALGLAADLDSEAGLAAIEVLAGARERAQRLRALDAERETLVARRTRFVSEVADVLRAVGRDEPTDETAASAAVQQLIGALRETQAQYQQRRTRESDRTAEVERRATHQQDRAEALRRLATLCQRAGVEETDALTSAIAAGERHAALIDERTRLAATLNEQGDGVPIADLVAAVEASDLDRLREQTEALRHEIDDLDQALGQARDTRNEARSAFEAIGGDDRAAVAATERQTALADMTDAAERYLRVGIAASLLKWASQRYAMDKHGPLIARGSTLMNHLTGGSVAGLTGEFDDADELQIVGVRGDGSPVTPEHMSEGTRDQLYLALRVAAIEDYLERAAPLPVVADDLFINFDDDRAIAGLEILATLSRRTQVLFFTHHAHLRDMAARTLGNQVATHEL